MSHITLVTGGARSGKSTFGEKRALELSSSPIYLATAHHWDEDFDRRIERHQAVRAGKGWTTIEEEIEIGHHDFTGRVVLLDCVTLWLTNIFEKNGYDLDMSLSIAKEEWDSFIQQDFTLIVVTNELGMGVHAMEESTRHFIDLQGFVNQYIASLADEVYLCVCGIPVRIKG